MKNSPTILVIGDAMLDVYVYGDVSRVSPEAPVPILCQSLVEKNLGGAAAVAKHLAVLGADVWFGSVVGNDEEGQLIRSFLQEMEVNCQAMIFANTRGTTTKTRYLSRSQQMLRVDREDTIFLPEETKQYFQNCLWECKENGFDVIVISDYDKGVVFSGLVEFLVQWSKELDIPCIVDPARITDYSRYSGVSVITPNRVEVNMAALKIYDSHENDRARNLLLVHGIGMVVFTKDSDGISLITRSDVFTVPARKREVYDVTGAGDVVLAVFAWMMARREQPDEAVRMANIAAGVSVGKLGNVSVTREEIEEEMRRDG